MTTADARMLIADLAPDADAIRVRRIRCATWIDCDHCEEGIPADDHTSADFIRQHAHCHDQHEPAREEARTK